MAWRIDRIVALRQLRLIRFSQHVTLRVPRPMLEKEATLRLGTIKWLCHAFVVLALVLFSMSAWSRGGNQVSEIAPSSLPPEAQQTLLLIKQGKPLPYPKDGAVFGNYEGVLPKQKRGYYHEYTVKTPGAHNRGARRIIAGGTGLSREYFYTDDHYVSFKRIRD